MASKSKGDFSVSFEEVQLEFMKQHFATQNTIVELLTELVADKQGKNIKTVRNKTDKTMDKYYEVAHNLLESLSLG